MTDLPVSSCAEWPRTGRTAHLCGTGAHRSLISRSKPVRAQVRTGVHGTCACARRFIAGTGAQPSETHNLRMVRRMTTAIARANLAAAKAAREAETAETANERDDDE